MPIVVVIGADPALGLLSGVKTPYGNYGPLTDYRIAGALRQKTLELTTAETFDVAIPASAEIVLEGVLRSDLQVPEGPFGEFFGYMSPQQLRPVFEIRRITHRSEPVYQNIVSQKPPSESMMLQSIGIAGLIYKHLVHDHEIKNIIDVHVTEQSSLAHIIVKVSSNTPRGEIKDILNATWTGIHTFTGKIISVVDEDIDIRNPLDLEWAYCSRVRPDQDVTILADTEPLVLDPSVAPPEVPQTDRTAAKMLVDATKKWAYPEQSIPPRDLMDNVADHWTRYGLPELP